jgi:hypothetical protein
MPQENNKQNAIKEAAKKYVDEQLQVLKKHGSVTRVSKNEYNSMVNQVVRASAK